MSMLHNRPESSGRAFSARFAGLVIVLSLVACSGDPGPDSGHEIGDDIPAIDALFAAHDGPGLPGCALAVGQDGEPIYTRGYGYANLDYDLPITPQTVFDVASVTKQFNAASITMLHLEGKLSLDDDIRLWLPELPAFETPITLQHMMYHTSGLRDYLNLFPLAGRGDYYPISHEQIRDMMSRQRAPIFPAGERYAYSNTAYMLLAQVVERAGGQSLGEITEERIFAPLDMDGTVMYDDFEMVIPNRATGYDRDDDGQVFITHNYNFDVVGDGQLYTTVEDLLKWDDFLHGTDKPDIHEFMLTEGHLNNGEPTGYAQGLRLRDYRGLQTVGHSGSSWGFRTELVRFVEPGLSIAVACNSDYARPGDLAKQVADHLLADQLGPVPDDAAADDESPDGAPAEALVLTVVELDEFAGEYFSVELDATYRFSPGDGKLRVRIEQEPLLDVIAVAEDRFEIRFYDQALSGPQTASLEFDRNRSGAVTGFGLSSGSERGIVFERR